jgi:ankyrin repeat protein
MVDLLLPYYNTKDKMNLQDANGDHALLYAVLNKNARLVKQLLKAGSDADLANKYNATALWYSIYNNDLESFMALIPHVSDFNRASVGVEYNRFQFPPEIIYQTAVSYVELAEEKDCYSMIYFLKLFGANVSQSIVGNLFSKLKQINFAFKAKIVEEARFRETIKKIECLIRFLRTPLSLARLTRLNILNEKSLKTFPLAKPLDDFLSFKYL